MASSRCSPPVVLMLLLSMAETESILSAISFNQPSFCPNASWNPIANTFADSSTIGTQPLYIFINTDNTVFVTHGISGSIVIWENGSISPTMTILANLSTPGSLFVTGDGEIFVYNGCPNGRVDRWTVNQTSFPSPLFTSSPCWALFVDIQNNLYCSQATSNQVISKALNSLPNTVTIIAGTSCAGTSSDTLNTPRGIFVASNLDLYVADCGNNRVQMFRSGERNATTVAGNGASGAIALICPSGVTLDADGYLFIVDSGRHRVVGEGPLGFECLVGCSGSVGSTATELNTPNSLSFDNMGNILVVDTYNNRIQQFMLTTGLCSKWRRHNDSLDRFRWVLVVWKSTQLQIMKEMFT